jgi:molybdate transport system substrate-binding protein
MIRFFTIVLCGWLVAVARGETLTVAAAVSLRDVLAPIAADFSKASGHQIEFVFGSSGQLAAQIRAGAPIDLFISAADKPVDDLADLVDRTSRLVFAGNRLTVIVPAAAKLVPATIADLANVGFERIAIGEPGTVPAGMYATQVLARARVAVDADRLVFATNVRQVLMYVSRGDVSAGIVYVTDVGIDDGVKQAFVVPADLHDRIEYPMVIVAASGRPTTARAFMSFLRSDAARQKLTAAGFIVPPGEDER